MSESRGNKPELVHWITERWKVLHLKDAGFEKPWSEDPVFQTTYFCNVRREDDKVTKWIRTNWSQGYPKENYTLAMMAARLFNRPSTLEQLKYPDRWEPEEWRGKLKFMEAMRVKVWGNAYVVTTHGIPGNKIDYAIRILSDAYEKAPIFNFSTLDHYHRCLMTMEGFGSFMAAQVVADLKNTPNHPLQKAEDWWTFCAPGPGSLRGIEWALGRKVSPAKFPDEMRALKDELEPQYELKLCAQDFQNCLCEFDKYMRVRNGTGRSKRGYPGQS